jgi:putative transposase
MLPRQVPPRQFYLITRRCSRREFLLRPDLATNNAFLYCLINAALRCEIDVVLPCVMSNHYHAVIYDRAGRYPESSGGRIRTRLVVGTVSVCALVQRLLRVGS